MAYTATFWGTRGSIPTPGAHTARYGGNTSCVAVQGTGGQLVILDAGTGIRALGATLVQNGSVQADILLSHTHWDHIQGLPYFKPFFSSGSSVRIWGAKQGTKTLDEILHLQMDPAVFPIPLTAAAADLTVEEVRPGGDFKVGAFGVRTFQVRHPGTTLAYRLAPVAQGRSMAYVTDNELGSGGSYDERPKWRQELLGFLKGVDLLIHDAMYTPAELESHRGWGHSSYEEAVELAADVGAKRLALFHHEPEHDDRALDALLAAARQTAERRGAPVEVVAAQEGMQLSL